MHNTNVFSSKANKEMALANKRYANHPRGCAMRLMEMYQMMLKYPEVCIIVVFENIPTMRLELHASIERTI